MRSGLAVAFRRGCCSNEEKATDSKLTQIGEGSANAWAS
jgi:hypothetical protein